MVLRRRSEVGLGAQRPSWRWWCDCKRDEARAEQAEARGRRAQHTARTREAYRLQLKTCNFLRMKSRAVQYMNLLYKKCMLCGASAVYIRVRSSLTPHDLTSPSDERLSASERFLRAAAGSRSRHGRSSEASASHSARTGATCVVTIHLLGQRSCLQCIRYGRLVHY